MSGIEPTNARSVSLTGSSFATAVAGGCARSKRAGKRPDPAAAMVDLEQVAVEIGDPLLTLCRQFEVDDRVLDVGLDLRLEELRVHRGKISRGLAPEPLDHPRFGKFGEQGVQLAVIEGVGKLA